MQDIFNKPILSNKNKFQYWLFYGLVVVFPVTTVVYLWKIILEKSVINSDEFFLTIGISFLFGILWALGIYLNYRKMVNKRIKE